jgi:hypothetical protein
LNIDVEENRGGGITEGGRKGGDIVKFGVDVKVFIGINVII